MRQYTQVQKELDRFTKVLIQRYGINAKPTNRYGDILIKMRRKRAEIKLGHSLNSYATYNNEKKKIRDMLLKEQRERRNIELKERAKQRAKRIAVEKQRLLRQLRFGAINNKQYRTQMAALMINSNNNANNNNSSLASSSTNR